LTGVRVASALEGAGYRVMRAAGALDGLNKLYQTYPDMIIMDGELSVVNGEDACMRVREASYLPMIVLGSPEKAVEVLELGVDAFMTKPPSLIELVARVGRLLERIPKFNTRTYSGEQNTEYDLPAGGNGLSSLSTIEFRLALCLVLSEGKIVDYSQLASEAWEGQEVSLETLHFHMRGLREKLQAFFRGRIRIVNHLGVGYRLEEDK
jgi:DNA-binding response OmpR family regulator